VICEPSIARVFGTGLSRRSIQNPERHFASTKSRGNFSIRYWSNRCQVRIGSIFARLPRGHSGRPRTPGVLAGRVFEIPAPLQPNALSLRRDLFRSVFYLSRNHSWPERDHHLGSRSLESIQYRKHVRFGYGSAARVAYTFVECSRVMRIDPDQFTHCVEHRLSVPNSYQCRRKFRQREVVVRYERETLV